MLTRFMLRAATVRALRGHTYARGNVRDSEQMPIDELALDQPTPVIVVYTDDAQLNANGRDLWSYSGDGRVDVGFQHLVIEIAITQRMRLQDENGNAVEDTVPLQTDAAMEFTLDLMERQVVTALMDPRPTAVWAAMWRDIVVRIATHETQRGANAQQGVRFAGRQIRFSVKLLREPVPGSESGPVVARFLDLAETDPDLIGLVPAIRSALAGTFTPAELTIMTYGLSRGEAAAMEITQ